MYVRSHLLPRPAAGRDCCVSQQVVRVAGASCPLVLPKPGSQVTTGEDACLPSQPRRLCSSIPLNLTRMAPGAMSSSVSNCRNAARMVVWETSISAHSRTTPGRLPFHCPELSRWRSCAAAWSARERRRNGFMPTAPATQVAAPGVNKIIPDLSHFSFAIRALRGNGLPAARSRARFRNPLQPIAASLRAALPNPSSTRLGRLKTHPITPCAQLRRSSHRQLDARSGPLA